MYGLPATAVGTVGDVNTSGEVVTVSIRLLCADLAGMLPSVNVNVSGNEPPTVGVPVRMP
jgi:hypothetical protein